MDIRKCPFKDSKISSDVPDDVQNSARPLSIGMFSTSLHIEDPLVNNLEIISDGCGGLPDSPDIIGNTNEETKRCTQKNSIDGSGPQKKKRFRKRRKHRHARSSNVGTNIQCHVDDKHALLSEDFLKFGDSDIEARRLIESSISSIGMDSVNSFHGYTHNFIDGANRQPSQESCGSDPSAGSVSNDNRNSSDDDDKNSDKISSVCTNTTNGLRWSEIEDENIVSPCRLSRNLSGDNPRNPFDLGTGKLPSTSDRCGSSSNRPEIFDSADWVDEVSKSDRGIRRSVEGRSENQDAIITRIIEGTCEDPLHLMHEQSSSSDKCSSHPMRSDILESDDEVQEWTDSDDCIEDAFKIMIIDGPDISLKSEETNLEFIQQPINEHSPTENKCASSLQQDEICISKDIGETYHYNGNAEWSKSIGINSTSTQPSINELSWNSNESISHLFETSLSHDKEKEMIQPAQEVREEAVPAFANRTTSGLRQELVSDKCCLNQLRFQLDESDDQDEVIEILESDDEVLSVSSKGIWSGGFHVEEATFADENNSLVSSTTDSTSHPFAPQQSDEDDEDEVIEIIYSDEDDGIPYRTSLEATTIVGNDATRTPHAFLNNSEDAKQETCRPSLDHRRAITCQLHKGSVAIARSPEDVNGTEESQTKSEAKMIPQVLVSESIQPSSAPARMCFGNASWLSGVINGNLFLSHKKHSSEDVTRFLFS